MKRIGDIVKEFRDEFGVSVSEQNIRIYEKSGLFTPTKLGANNQRQYDEISIANIKRVLMLLQIGLTPSQVLYGSQSLIDNRIESVEKILKELKKKARTNGIKHTEPNRHEVAGATR